MNVEIKEGKKMSKEEALDLKKKCEAVKKKCEAVLEFLNGFDFKDKE